MWHLLLNILVTILLLRSDTGAQLSVSGPVLSLNPLATVLNLPADKGAVLSATGRDFFYTKNADEPQAIASITKLMTALVFIEHNPGWDTTYTITAADQVQGGVLNLWPGDEVTIKQLFKTSLIASDNGATLALVHASGLSEPEFVKKMNEKALALGLKKTSFVDPVGLGENNVSTAREVALLAKAALDVPEISTATETKDFKFTTVAGREKLIESTDYLLFDSAENPFIIMGGKTGFTDSAGYCFVGRFKGADGREVISAVLNSSGKNERFRESKDLVNWVFNNYEWRP
ncbi:MAG: serine hydrolase [Patescibacteria group bacterium]